MQLSELYHECHSNGHNHLAEGAADGWDEVVERIARGLHDGTLKPADLDVPTLKRTAKQLMTAVFEGAGTNFDDPDLGGDQYDLLQKFEKNIYYFSGFKNYQQLKEANELLLDENRNIRPFSEFLQLVKKINTKYNVNYLSAEYGHAVASAQMATKWQEIQAQQEYLPFLQYDTVGDDRVRDEHRGIDGVIRRVDDDFWKTWYPPNGWNCRCSVRQLDDATETPVADIVYPELLPMFRTNVGMSEVVFPAKHPYFKNTGKATSNVINSKVAAIIPARTGPIISKPVKTLEDIDLVLREYAARYPKDFARGYKSTGEFTGNIDRMFETDCSGSILISKKDVGYGTKGFIPFKQLTNALNKIRTKKALSFTEDYAVEALWHEILHNTARFPMAMFNNDLRTTWMEICNQFTARKTYHEFMERLGGTATRQPEILEKGLGYEEIINNFRATLRYYKLDEDAVLKDVKAILLNSHYNLIGNKMFKYLQKATGDKDNIFSIYHEIELDNEKFSKNFLTN